jgi:hypothetical protein
MFLAVVMMLVVMAMMIVFAMMMFVLVLVFVFGATLIEGFILFRAHLCLHICLVSRRIRFFVTGMMNFATVLRQNQT